MKCPNCEETMDVDAENKQYICECGNTINWSKEQM